MQVLYTKNQCSLFSCFFLIFCRPFLDKQGSSFYNVYEPSLLYFFNCRSNIFLQDKINSERIRINSSFNVILFYFSASGSNFKQNYTYKSLYFFFNNRTKWINTSLQQFKDVTIQYQEMRQNQALVLKSIKQYLNNYAYLLAYLQKQKLQLYAIESISKELIRIKQFFLSFSPSKPQQNNQQKLEFHQQVAQMKGQYQKINQINSVRKITFKTSQMINFMRTHYFNLPSIEAVQCVNKNIKYINEEQEQQPILVISAQSYKLGKILHWNLAAAKMLNYNAFQLRSMNVSDLVPKDVSLVHHQIWLKLSLQIEVEQKQKHLNTQVFCFTKSMYVQICSLSIQTNCSVSGNKWIVYFTPQFKQESIIVVDKYGTIIGINKNAGIFGITLNSYGDQLNQKLFESIITKKQKVTVESGEQISQNVIINKKGVWKLYCQTPIYKGMNPYYIILIEPDIISILSSQIKCEQNQIQQIISQKFQFNFDPYQLKYTNNLQEHRNLQGQDITNNIFSYQQNGMKPLQRRQNGVSYGQNINEMVYMNGILEFKQNYQQVTQFQTHPNYVNGNFQSQENNIQMIKKENLIENLNKINQKYPTSVIISLVVVVFLFLISLGLRISTLVSTSQIYTLKKQKSDISILSYTRRNLLYDIGNLAIYLQKNQSQPQIWTDFQLKQFKFQSLFVNIQITNGQIDAINGDISALTHKKYLVNGKFLTLQKQIESLQIIASTFSTPSFNLTKFVLLILNDINKIQMLILQQVNTYYVEQLQYLRYLCQYMNVGGILILIFGLIWLYYNIRNIQCQKYWLFKSVCFLNDQQITKIQANLQVNRNKLKQNEIDSIFPDDYSVPQVSQNLHRVKRLDESLLKTKKILFYPIFLSLLILLGTAFAESQKNIQDMQIITQIDPFIQISNQERLFFSQIFIMLMAKVKVQNLQTKIQDSIIFFQDVKFNIIQSLIQQPFSSNFMSFYQQIWFNSCQKLNVTTQCNSLFSGLINDNLDYSFIYVITFVNKVLISGQYLATTGYSNSSQVYEVMSSIQIDQQKIIFLMFKLLSRLRAQFNENINTEVQKMNKSLNDKILRDFFIFTICALILFGLFFKLILKLKNMTMRALQIIICIIPFEILCRSKHFVSWYRQKFNDIY